MKKLPVHVALLAAAAAAMLYTGRASAAEEGAEEQKGPFKESFTKRTDARPGWMLLSDDRILEGYLCTSRGRPLVIFDRAEKKYFRLEWNDVARVDVAIEKDTLEQDWRWKEGGSDVKVYTDLWYVWHKYLTTITLKDGERHTGDLTAPIYILPEGEEEQQRFIFHRRSKGEKAKKEEALPPLHIRKLVLTDVDGAEQPPEPEGEQEEKQTEEGEAVGEEADEE
jgi:hypothetical protein